MAIADLLVIITEVILNQINAHYFPVCFLDITPICSLRKVLQRGAIDCSVWFTIIFSFDRFVAICCQTLKTKYCTEKAAAVVLATTSIVLLLKNIPFYFTQEPEEIVNNVPWRCIDKETFYTEVGWMGFAWFDRIMTPLVPFALILLFNALTIRHIITVSQVRKELRCQSKRQNDSDSEMESRRKSMILLFSISGSFILLWLVNVIEFFYYQILGIDRLRYYDSEYIFQQAGIMLRNLSCCTNTFIYAATQSKFRAKFTNAVKYLMS
ncbi:probable G-protein coupled receptor 139 [Hemiscyllium ocellatum]|uniref:probable G-protein coupled receptor 139 n=1 Tax=Hemiscyllium ocellatum TaxID=170820 RepID=UPI002966232D|nr:probable G-protein coupled receptor 139 [Hemiscyllium ocellatum]